MTLRSEILPVQYLRGFCAAAVVVDHTAAMAGQPKYFGTVFLGGALDHGRLGVDIFFVISGFIMTVVSLESGSWKPLLSRASFFSKRFARIVPLMWLAIISYLVLRMVGSNTAIVPVNYLRAVLLWPDGQVEPNHMWTLRHEFIFYILFAVSFFGRPAMRWVLVGWFVSPVFYAAVTGIYWQTVPDRHFFSILMNSANLEFASGTIVGLAWLRWPERRTFHLPIHPWLVFGILTLGVISASAFTGLPWMSVPGTLITASLGAAVVALATVVECPRDRLSAFGRLLGNASYSIYLFHPHIASALLSVSSRLLHKQHPLWATVSIVLIVTAVGVAIHLLIEKPLVRAAQRLLQSRPIITNAAA